MSDQPKLTLTTARQAVVSVLAGAVVCGMLIVAVEPTGNFLPVVPWTVPALLAILAAAVVIYSRILRKKIEEKRVSAQESVTALVLGKAMVATGALFAGGHIVYVARYLQLAQAPMSAQRVVNGLLTLVAALLLAGAGSLLERACVVRDDDPEHPGGSTASPA